MRLGIVGNGVVGRALARAFMEHCDVRTFDVVPERATHSYDETLDSDLIFVTLPTPQQSGSLACDTSIVDAFFANIARNGLHRRKNYVLRSTVPVGTTRRLRHELGLDNLVFSPEFLTSRCALVDAQVPARNIVGGHTCDAMVALVKLYERRFPGVTIQWMGSDEAELVKLGQNAAFAVKVAFWNELRSLCDAMSLDWSSVRKGILADGRITHAHTQVPGPSGGRGFGGSCLPKDLASFVSQIEARGLCAAVTRGALERNVRDRGGRA